MATTWPQDDAVDVDRRPPRQLVPADHEGTNRAGAQAKAAPGALPLAVRASPPPLPAPPPTLATGITVTPSFSYGSPNTRFTVSTSRPAR
jgi:hypothetical protein